MMTGINTTLVTLFETAHVVLFNETDSDSDDEMDHRAVTKLSSSTENVVRLMDDRTFEARIRKNRSTMDTLIKNLGCQLVTYCGSFIYQPSETKAYVT